jgi:phage gpG-like protein
MSLDLEKMPEQIRRELLTLPIEAGNIAVNHFKEKFTGGNQHWEGAAWEKRKPRGHRRKDGTFVAAKARRSDQRNLLVGKGSGRLKKSIRITSATADSVGIGSDVPYAEVHNEGLRAGRGTGFQMPKRQFMGMENSLEKKIDELIENKLNNIFR